jgi:predicted nucleic acid-binding Zn ribbon protein
MDDKRPKDSQTLPIGRILPDVLRTCRRGEASDMDTVVDIWSAAVGTAIAENTRPTAFKGRLLLVHVSSSVWLHQLQFVKQDLIDKVNAVGGRRLVEGMTFKIGPLDPDTRPDE